MWIVDDWFAINNNRLFSILNNNKHDKIKNSNKKKSVHFYYLLGRQTGTQQTIILFASWSTSKGGSTYTRVPRAPHFFSWNCKIQNTYLISSSSFFVFLDGNKKKKWSLTHTHIIKKDFSQNPFNWGEWWKRWWLMKCQMINDYNRCNKTT